MISISDRPCEASSSGVYADEADRLRLAFHARLQSERVHFVTLSAALARVEESPDWIFHDLRNRAHKIRGTAAMFEIAEVAAAARALELASISASTSHAENTDAAVWNALVALVRLMGAIDANELALDPVAPGEFVIA